MSTAGPNNPGTVADDAAVGTLTWTNPGNAAANDGSEANCYNTSSSYATSHYLKATNFGFAIPTDATINGVLVQIEKRRNASASALDVTVSLVKGGTVSGANKAETATEWSSSANVSVSYGGVSDLWSLALDPGDVNGSTFGVVLSHKQRNLSKTGRYVYVDHIRITITYTEAGGGTSAVPVIMNSYRQRKA